MARIDFFTFPVRPTIRFGAETWSAMTEIRHPIHGRKEGMVSKVD